MELEEAIEGLLCALHDLASILVAANFLLTREAMKLPRFHEPPRSESARRAFRASARAASDGFSRTIARSCTTCTDFEEQMVLVANSPTTSHNRKKVAMFTIRTMRVSKLSTLGISSPRPEQLSLRSNLPPNAAPASFAGSSRSGASVAPSHRMLHNSPEHVAHPWSILVLHRALHQTGPYGKIHRQRAMESLLQVHPLPQHCDGIRGEDLLTCAAQPAVATKEGRAFVPVGWSVPQGVQHEHERV